MKKKVGFVSFRFAGVDGVTLETSKWAEIFTRSNWECHYCAGESEFSRSHSYIDSLLHFNHPEIRSITARCFSNEKRSYRLTEELHDACNRIKKTLYKFIKERNIELLVVQNVLAIPMNIPFSMALVEILAETRMPTIAHHHDFYWERDRYMVNCVQDILSGCFPPHLPNITHVAINSIAMRQLGYRRGIAGVVVPNVMEFERPAPDFDDYSVDLRKDFGIEKNEWLFLQPTRIVQRKGIEHAMELTRRFGDKAVLVISHSSGDEGDEYQQRVLEFAELLNIRVLLTADKVRERRAIAKDGSKIYSLADIYNCADLVTYPSIIEGFGNAFLEAVYYRRPVIINRYPVYTSDIKPKGFDCIEFDNFISAEKIEEVKKLLSNPDRIQQMTDTNYDLSLRYYSYGRLYKKIEDLLERFFGI